MLTTDLIGANGEISEAAVVQFNGDAVQALASHMAREIIGAAQTRGIDVEADDVFVWRRPDDDVNRRTMTRRYGAVWAPDPVERGVEFYGGSHDGEVLTGVPREDGPGAAFPPPLLRVMGQPVGDPLIEQGAEPPIANAAIVEDYVRAGIDSRKRRFIYKIKVTN